MTSKKAARVLRKANGFHEEIESKNRYFTQESLDAARVMRLPFLREAALTMQLTHPFCQPH